MARLNAQDLGAALAGLGGWQSTGDAITRTYQFGDFMQAVAFVNRVAPAAEAANHHPDIDIRYNRVIIGLTTHDEGGVTEKDVDLARRINALERA